MSITNHRGAAYGRGQEFRAIACRWGEAFVYELQEFDGHATIMEGYAPRYDVAVPFVCSDDSCDAVVEEVVGSIPTRSTKFSFMLAAASAR